MAMGTNLFDYFDDVARGDEAEALWAPRAPYRPHERFDLMLVPRVREWREDEASRHALEQIKREPWVDAVSQDGGQVWLRLRSGWIEEAGAGFEPGAGEEGANADIAAGRRFALNFWDANSTKALHVGHLRNLALGNALGAALTEAGGQVERRSIICDVGRSMGEAMAGVARSGRHLGSSPGNDQKSDHFVGYCYADYVKAGRGVNELAQDHPADSLTREVDVHNDSADELLLRVLSGDQAALELWSQTRAWVISGQRKTLARLGIAFDRVFFESDFLPEVAELTELGLEEGTLERRPDGAVFYETGREELEEMPLVRSDGVPTQHMRALAYWMAAPGLDGTTSIQVCGLEWVSHVTCRRQLMAELAHTSTEGNGFHPYHDIFHGMVARERQAVKSSKKEALLIDHLVDWIDEQIDADPERAGVRGGHPSPEQIAAQVALGYFLLHPATKRVNFEPERLLVDGKSLGWDMARARARGSGGGAGGGELAEDPDYRFAVVQAEMVRRHLRLAARRLNPIPLARFASHLSRWYLERERRPEVERVVQATLDESARGLGLEGAG